MTVEAEPDAAGEAELLAELAGAKARLREAQTVEERIELRARVGELTQRIRRLRMEEAGR